MFEGIGDGEIGTASSPSSALWDSQRFARSVVVRREILRQADGPIFKISDGNRRGGRLRAHKVPQFVKLVGNTLTGRFIDQDEQFQIGLTSSQRNPIRYAKPLLSLKGSHIFLMAYVRHVLAVLGPDRDYCAHCYCLGWGLLRGPSASAAANCQPDSKDGQPRPMHVPHGRPSKRAVQSDLAGGTHIHMSRANANNPLRTSPFENYHIAFAGTSRQ
jgi:hypothetical protein